MAKKSEARLGKGLAAIFGEDVNDVLEDIQQGKSGACAPAVWPGSRRSPPSRWSLMISR